MRILQPALAGQPRSVDYGQAQPPAAACSPAQTLMHSHAPPPSPAPCPALGLSGCCLAPLRPQGAQPRPQHGTEALLACRPGVLLLPLLLLTLADDAGRMLLLGPVERWQAQSAGAPPPQAQAA